jgi:N-acetylglucosamine-6-sulfatase
VITSGTTSPSLPAGTHPNVVFVLTDDMRLDDLQFMPKTRELLAGQGMTFDSYFDNVTLCCPARTSILRGQFSHNTGVLTNDVANGGFETVFKDKLESSTIATALQAAGYRTGLFGKYLNGYPHGADPAYIPPGWDTWVSSTKGSAYGEYNYTLNENGKSVEYGNTPADYGTDVYLRKATAFMTAAEAEHKPFFAYIAGYAPHTPATPAPQDKDLFPDLKAPRDASYNEQDVSDKPDYIKVHSKLTPQAATGADRLYRLRAQSLQAVDRGVAGLYDHLKATGQLDNTYFVFTSDNGFHLGQHRLPSGKQTAYETDIHLPLLIRGPGVVAGSTSSAIVGNIDLAPTFADLAGTKLAHAVDGRSLVPILASGGAKPATPDGWRNSFLLEHWTTSSTQPVDRTGSGELEPDDPDQATTPSNTPVTTNKKGKTGKPTDVAIPEFAGIRTATYTYVEYVTNEIELYDLTKDPDELTNLASTAPKSQLDALHQRVTELKKCAADTCRTIESQPLVA